MANSSSLKLLIELAQQQVDTSARKLGQLNYQQQEAEKKLNLLLQYRQSYQLQLQNSIANGIDQIEWRNFNAFLNKLDAAVAEQRQAVLHAKTLTNIANNEFLACQRKLKSYSTLSKRQHMAEILRQNKLEQKLLDEFAINSVWRKSSSS